jgi:hypothetical protein
MMLTTVTSQDEAEDSQHSSAMTTQPRQISGKVQATKQNPATLPAAPTHAGRFGDVTHSNRMTGVGPRAWTGSWTGAPDNPSAANAVGAIVRAIGAASARVALGRTSHNPPVVGSSLTRPTCGFTMILGRSVDRIVDSGMSAMRPLSLSSGMAISHLAGDGVDERAETVDLDLVADRYIRSFDHRAAGGFADDPEAPGGRVLGEADSGEWHRALLSFRDKAATVRDNRLSPQEDDRSGGRTRASRTAGSHR